ncbi:sensor histidine kinase [Phenylobacterium sp. J426]|uniref:sensor histidine kinase n=1 Tax=Phenylobacterium sp. J426 TaxID=2898439 RepID=UPI002151BEA4|nr:sensor histidine kinase [Phenylobacterium sp. J426]MCR5873376.1 sensor histidine kinase [Phenylobacterium sp. J426]
MSADEIDSLRQALAAQAELQREADHRVKNNLQLISSLVMLHGRRATDDGAKRALKSVQQRITAVSAAHRHVSRDTGSERVDLAALVRELTGDLAAAAGREGIEITLELEPVFVAAPDAAPLALILNEALGNALTHAFPGARAGRIVVALRRTPDGFDLAVSDDGVGQAGAAPGFGRMILQLLAQQLRAKLEVTAAQPGLRVAVSVPAGQPKP